MKSNKLLKIGTLVFTVSKGWNPTKKYGAQVVPCRIVGYQNIEGKVYPILERRGYTHKEINPESNLIFTDLEDAVAAIQSKK